MCFFPTNQPFPCLPGKVGPQTGWLCPNDDCTPCDMYKLPDYNTESRHRVCVADRRGWGIELDCGLEVTGICGKGC